jgi:hypothetical protein
MTSRRWIEVLPEYLALAAILIISSGWCLTAARHLGATFDEPLYLRAGLAFWHNAGGNDLVLLRGTMPLPQDVEALFLRIAEHIRGAPWNPQLDIPQMLPVAREGALVFWWILLIYAWKTGKLIGGMGGGLLAAALIAIEPIMLGHASLATTDIAVTAFVVTTNFYFAVGRNSNWTRRIGIPSLCCGLAILSKASGLAFSALCMLATEVERLWPPDKWPDSPVPVTVSAWIEGWRDRLQPFWHDLRQIIGIGLLITIVYCGSGWHPQGSFVAWAKTLPPQSASGAVMLWLAENLRIFNNAISGLVYQFKHNMHGQPAYLLGRVQSSFWYYYPLALTIKLSIPIFVIALTLVCLRVQALRNCAMAAACALLAFSVLLRLQIGVRLVLPLVAFLIIGIAAALANARQVFGPGLKSRLLTAEVLLALVWTGVGALRIWPQGICYTNALWGGTSRGYLYLSDSNYDWGQGVPDLERWQRSRGLKRIAVLYFGTDPRVTDKGFSAITLQDFSAAKPPLIARQERLRYLAVGTTLAYGSYYDAAELRKLTPVARTQTFLIYDLDPLATKTPNTAPRRHFNSRCSEVPRIRPKSRAALVSPRLVIRSTGMAPWCMPHARAP